MRNKIKVEKKRCATCAARNRRVREVAYFGKLINLCEECAVIAAKLAKREDDKKAAVQEAKKTHCFIPGLKMPEVADNVRDILKATRPTIPLRPLTIRPNA